MGLILWIAYKLFYPVLFSGTATYIAFRLGNELPIASRIAGQKVGMGYNYMKVALKVLD